MELPTGKKIILFDGVCNLCNSWVRRVIRGDTGDVFRLAPLQSEIGRILTTDRGIDRSRQDSIVLIDPGIAYYIKSDAALEISKDLKGYRWVSPIFGWIPRPIRDLAYNLIARNRYKWFGRQDSCMVPDEKVRNKFLDNPA